MNQNLTDRELEIAQLAARGVPNKEIAKRLYVTKRTVESHLHSVYAKTKCVNRVHLYLWMYGLGMEV